MTIDIRASVSCSLGPVISGSIGDDYIQGSGLIKTTGSVTIDDLITPNIGTIVTFSYTKQGTTYSIPRKLRVKSSFADPFRRTTQVELGCKLDYLSDLKDRLSWDAFNDPENSSLTEDDSRVITIPIRASSVMNKCLAELGITASSNPLTNKFSIAEFDFSAGYVSVLNDLLVSESYCGYLNTNEVLQVFPLDQNAGTGPVITVNDIIDLSPIGVGNLPGEAVTVSYSTLKLRPPEPAPESGATPEEQQQYQEQIDRINWERSETIGSPQFYYIDIENKVTGAISVKAFTGTTSITTETSYVTINYLDENRQQARKEVPRRRTTTTTGPSISKLGSVAASYYNDGTGNFNNVNIILSQKIEEWEYDVNGNEKVSKATTYEPEAIILASAAFDWVYDGANFVASYQLMASDYTEQIKEYSSVYEQTTTSQYVKWAETQPGSQAIAMQNKLVTYDTMSKGIRASISILGGGLAHHNTTQVTNYSGADRNRGQQRPSTADRTNSANANGGDPNNGWRTESTSDLELAIGSATAQRRIELSMPYAPDDIFYGPTGGPFGVIASDAPVKATRYGRVQNRLLLGNRNGISLQLAPEKLPEAPYSPIYVEANGLTAQYRANGTNWAFDANGIICSVDALFWSAVGGTGVFWFPVAPGIVTLPSTPAAIDGQITPTSTILPYNETVIYDSRIRLATVIVSSNYSLTLLTIVPGTPVKLKTAIERGITAETGAFILANEDTQVLAALRRLPADPSAFTLTDKFVRLRPDRLYPAEPGAFALSSQGSTLYYSGGDPYWSEVKLLLHGEGVYYSQDFVDSGPLGLTATPNSNVMIMLDNSKFGTGSIYFDGAGDSLQYADNEAWNFGAGDFTIEAWIYPQAFSTFYIATQRTSSNIENAWLFYISGSFLSFSWTTGGNTSTAQNVSYDWTGGYNTFMWWHVAVCRSGNTIRLFVDGNIVATSTITDAIYNSSANMLVGRRGGTTSGSVGYIDELRITKTARYTANFAVQTEAFTEIPSSV